MCMQNLVVMTYACMRFYCFYSIITYATTIAIDVQVFNLKAIKAALYSFISLYRDIVNKKCKKVSC